MKARRALSTERPQAARDSVDVWPVTPLWAGGLLTAALVRALFQREPFCFDRLPPSTRPSARFGGVNASPGSQVC